MVEIDIMYVDVLFLVNFIMDFTILWATSKFTGFTASIKRIFAASLFGAIYSVMLFIPSLQILSSSILIKILVSVVMVIITFYPIPSRKLLQALAYFYLIVFAAGGAVFGCMYVLNSQAVDYPAMGPGVLHVTQVKYIWLLAALAAAVLFGKYGAKIIKANFFKSAVHVPAIICIGDIKIPIKTLVDTGNQLTDPLTGKPVMIAELETLASIIPPDVYNILQNQKDLDINTAVTTLAGTSLSSRIRLIPFNSIGKQRGMLVGIRPDHVFIVHNDKTAKVSDIIVGLYNYRLSPKGLYKGLLHPEILQMSVES
ncbi:MAG: sigma-E processing peptidase SpoIIGA [Bacillota bacterium]